MQRIVQVSGAVAIVSPPATGGERFIDLVARSVTGALGSDHVLIVEDELEQVSHLLVIDVFLKFVLAYLRIDNRGTAEGELSAGYSFAAYTPKTSATRINAFGVKTCSQKLVAAFQFP